MKTRSKKILTVCLALMMAVVMAVPAFATDDSNTLIERDYTPYISYEEQRNRFIADAENNGSEANISDALEHMQQVQDIASGKLVPITPYATSQNLDVPFYSQENDHYCGPATTRQTYRFFLHTDVNLPSQSQIAHELKTTTSGTDTNNIATYLNDTFGLGYQVLWSWDNSTLPALVTNNIGIGVPIILHVSISDTNAGRSGINDTSRWPYTTSGHYMNLNGYTNSGRVCNVTDPYADRVNGYSSGKYSVTYTAVNNVCDRAIF